MKKLMISTCIILFISMNACIVSADWFVCNRPGVARSNPGFHSDIIKPIYPGEFYVGSLQGEWVKCNNGEIYFIYESYGKIFTNELKARSYNKKQQKERKILEIKRRKQKLAQEARDEFIEAEERKQLKRQIAKFPQKIQQLILAKKISLGMTKNQVLFVKGNPIDINRTIGPWGIHEQWVYGKVFTRNYNNHSYLYFENGILTSWQD